MPFLIVESIWSAINAPLTFTISPNTSNTNFEISISFNVIERSESHVIEDDSPPPPTSLRAREVLSLKFRLQQKCLVPFLRVTRDWRAGSPSLKPIHFLSISSQNLETTILFSIEERSSSYVYKDQPPKIMQLAHYALKLNVALNKSKVIVFMVTNKTPQLTTLIIRSHISNDWGY